MEVSLGLRGHEDDECLLTLHGLCSTLPAKGITRTGAMDMTRDARDARDAEDVSSFSSAEHLDHEDASYGSFPNPLSLTPQPIGPTGPTGPTGPMSSLDRNSPRSKAISPNRPLPLPLVFHVSKADGEIWAKVIAEYKMFTPPLNILHYIGDVADHPQLPGIVFRKSADGDTRPNHDRPDTA